MKNVMRPDDSSKNTKFLDEEKPAVKREERPHPNHTERKVKNSSPPS